MKSVRFITLGCRLNQAEDAVLAGAFSSHGLSVTFDDEAADIVIVRSCAVTRQAERTTLQTVRALKRGQSDRLPIVILIGCAAAAIDKEHLHRAGVDIIVRKEDESNIIAIVDEFLLTHNAGAPLEVEVRGEFPKADSGIPDHSVITPQADSDFWWRDINPIFRYEKALLKVQDGCDFRCTYCIVPFTRGASVSFPIKELVKYAEKIFQSGYKELVLTGCNLAVYNDDGEDLGRLIEVLAESAKKYSACISLGSVEPAICDERIIEVMKSFDNLKKFIHLPIQSGDSEVLRIAGRRYDAEKLRTVIAKYRAEIPGLILSGDFITGLPGEDEAAFERTKAIVRDFAFDMVHVFPYSPRQGTKAIAYNRVTRTVAKARAAELRALHSTIVKARESEA